MSENQDSIMTPAQQKQRIREFVTALQNGIDSFTTAGKILVDLVDSDPHVYNYIIQECPTISTDLLSKLEMIGRGILLPSIAMSDSPGAKHLGKLPLSVQERFEHEPVPVIVQTDDGWDVLLVKHEDLTQNQARQVFRSGRIATEGEQRAWIEDYKLRERAKNEPAPISRGWKIKGNKVEFEGAITLSAQELASILAQIR